jgi:hypothetical protein
MTEDFDPYYKWLGIPPKEQPPHYYRLLGIEIFESDAEVIRNAAKLRALHVRSFQNGEYAIASQKMQKKIACAKACLLEPDKKAEYDLALRRKLSLPKVQPLAEKAKSPPSPELLPVPPPLPPPRPLPNYPEQSPAPQPSLQYTNTDYSLNPVIIARETCDWFRQHKDVTSVLVKLGCVAAVILIMLFVFAHGQNLWTYVFDKSSVVIAKITGSSEQKPPERIVRTKKVPGAKQENSANSAREPDGEVSAAPEAEKTSKAVPPPPVLEPAPAPETTAAPKNTQPPPAVSSTESSTAESSAETIVLNLPSEKTFKYRLFKVNINPLVDLLKDPAREDRVLFLEDPFERVYAFAEHKKGVLDGVCVAFHPNGRPMSYAVYKDGLLDGVMKTWNDKDEKVYWCQYEKGIRQGFCCYFKNNTLRLLLEIQDDAVRGIHLCANGQLKKSFASEDEVAGDKETKQLLGELNDLEAELKDNEIAFKKQIKSEDLRQRRERKVVVNPQKKAALQDQINRHNAEVQRLTQIIWQYKGW